MLGKPQTCTPGGRPSPVGPDVSKEVVHDNLQIFGAAKGVRQKEHGMYKGDGAQECAAGTVQHD